MVAVWRLWFFCKVDTMWQAWSLAESDDEAAVPASASSQVPAPARCALRGICLVWETHLDIATLLDPKRPLKQNDVFFFGST